MIKSKLIFIFIIWSQLLSAQILFTEVLKTLPFTGAGQSSLAIFDVDGDNDQDVIITGYTSNLPIAELYINDGHGNFTEEPDTPFQGVFEGSIAFSDIDGDNDQDVLITGFDQLRVPISKLYTNDGKGHFNEIPGTPFAGVTESSVTFLDIDADNDQDIIIVGRDGSSVPISKLYINDGIGNFTEKSDSLFQRVTIGSVAFSDVDGDNDQDAIITGRNSSYEPISKLYINNGTGHFDEVKDSLFIGVYESSIAFSDIDGDNDQDVLITGLDQFRVPISKLYINDGIGHFSEITGSHFEGVHNGSVAFTDVDMDNDQDLLITGRIDTSLVSKLYSNDGFGNFTEVTSSPIKGINSGSIVFSDLDSDTDMDLLITGFSSSNVILKQYSNDGQGNFSEVLQLPPFEGVSSSSIAFSDIDGDNDDDVLITGITGFGYITKLYTNDGKGNFSELMDPPFENVAIGSIDFADVDGDNDQDVIITGRKRNLTPIAKLYINDGIGNFTEVPDTPFQGVWRSSVAFSDVDGDNDQDLLLSGSISTNPITKMYINDGKGNFTERINISFDNILGNINFTDVDGDNDQDVLFTGWNDSTLITKLYINDGIGNFSEKLETPFEGVIGSGIAFSDIDGDNDQDLLITGKNSSDLPIAKIYTNDGNGNFKEMVGTPFEPVLIDQVAFSDVDGDNDQDLLIVGNQWFSSITKLYSNDGLGSFTEVIGTPFLDVRSSAIAFSDINGDNTPDLLITGQSNGVGRIAKLYINESKLTSISESENEINFEINPNPTQATHLNIIYGSKEHNLIKLNVFDIEGKLMNRQQTNIDTGNNTLTIDISHLNTGVYFIQLDDGKRKGIKKFIVQ